jgi:hypothetical protein
MVESHGLRARRRYRLSQAGIGSVEGTRILSARSGTRGSVGMRLLGRLGAG